MEAAQSGDSLRGRAQVEVIRVAQDHLRTGGVQVAGRQGLHRRLGADRHEVGVSDRAMRRVDATQPGMPDAGGCKGMSRQRKQALTPPERIGYVEHGEVTVGCD